MAELLTAGSVLYKVPGAGAIPDATGVITKVGVYLVARTADASKTPPEAVGANATATAGVGLA